MKRVLALALALCLCAALVGCGGSGAAVYVQSVEKLQSLGGIAPGDNFLGVVVSENVTEIKKDDDKTLLEVLVKAGDDVEEGQALFSYDTEELQLNLDKQRLELQQLEMSIESYETQIKSLEDALNTVGGTTRLRYTIEIQSTQVDLKEAQINLKTKEAEVKKSEELLANATVVSPVKGRVQAVNESGTDNYGNEQPYITIQQAGSYRVKGVLGEQQRGSLMEGQRLTITSRTNSDSTWGGTVTLVDYESPYQGSDNDRYYGMSSDEMTSSSRYPFYVELDSTEGLLLGQHVYLALDTGDEAPELSIGSAFVCYREDGSAYVWAENRGKLEERSVTLGDYNDMADTYAVLEGLSLEDYIAFPDPELCQPGAPTTHDLPEEETPAGGEEPVMEGGVA